MAYYRRRRRTYRRRPFRRRRRTYRRRRFRRSRVPRYRRFMRVRRPLLPTSLVVPMKICSQYTVSLEAGNSYRLIESWYPGNINAPVGGEAVRAFGFDQWNAFYDQYTVLGCTLRLRLNVINSAITSQHQPVFVLGLIRSTLFTNYSTLDSSSMATQSGFKSVFPQVGGGVNKPIRLTGKYRPGRFWGVDVATADELSAVFSQVPASQARFILLLQNHQPGGGNMTIQINYKMHFTVLLRRMQPVLPSVPS